ncbi:MAG: TIGR02444 family protein [Pseudomonadota bacterium]
MTPLWDYAITLYALKDVKPALIKLQDRYHFDVSHLLWCVWTARMAFPLSDEDVVEILASADELSRYGVRRLRAIRLFLSSPKPGIEPAALQDLRSDVLEAEIKGERLVLDQLQASTLTYGMPKIGSLPFKPRAEHLFTLTRRNVDMPVMITDEVGPGSPSGLFGQVIKAAEGQAS